MKAETEGEETSTLERAVGDEILLVDVSKEDDAAGVGGARELSYAKCIGSGDKHCCGSAAVFPSKGSCISWPIIVGTRPNVGPVGSQVMDS